MIRLVRVSLLLVFAQSSLCADVLNEGQSSRSPFADIRLTNDYLRVVLSGPDGKLRTGAEIEEFAANAIMQQERKTDILPMVGAIAACSAFIHCFVGTLCVLMTYNGFSNPEAASIFVWTGSIFSAPTFLIGSSLAIGLSLAHKSNENENVFDQRKKEYLSNCQGKACGEFIERVMRGERKGLWISKQNPPKYEEWSPKYDELHK